MLQALITFAAEAGAEPSKTPFYILGGLLAVYAVVISAIGVRGIGTFPNKGQGRGVMALSVLLVVATMASAVLTA